MRYLTAAVLAIIFVAGCGDDAEAQQYQPIDEIAYQGSQFLFAKHDDVSVTIGAKNPVACPDGQCPTVPVALQPIAVQDCPQPVATVQVEKPMQKVAEMPQQVEVFSGNANIEMQTVSKTIMVPQEIRYQVPVVKAPATVAAPATSYHVPRPQRSTTVDVQSFGTPGVVSDGCWGSRSYAAPQSDYVGVNVQAPAYDTYSAPRTRRCGIIRRAVQAVRDRVQGTRVNVRNTNRGQNVRVRNFSNYNPRWSVSGGDVRAHLAGGPHWKNTSGMTLSEMYRLHDQEHDRIGPYSAAMVRAANRQGPPRQTVLST